jgi:hypothetical protein
MKLSGSEKLPKEEERGENEARTEQERMRNDETNDNGTPSVSLGSHRQGVGDPGPFDPEA